MTDQQHPITPPPSLMRQWREQAPRYRDGGVGREHWLIERAGQWCADQELEACNNWLVLNGYGEVASKLRAARRPKPPSLKEQAWKLLECYGTSGVKLTADQCNTILRALKTIPDDWGVKLTADQCNTILRALKGAS
jgi:hypothetical protein